MKKIIYNVIALSLISFVVLLYAHGNMSKATIGFLRVTGISSLIGNVTFGGNLVSDTDGTDDIGSASVRWNAGYFDEVFWNKGADVASAASSFTLGADGNYYDITGTTNLDSIAAQTVGKIVALQFDAILTMTDGGNLKLIGDFVTAAGATMVLQSDGTDWYEFSRTGGSYVNLGLFEHGVDGTALNFVWFSGTAGDNMTWTSADEALTITGTNGQDALNIDDGNVDIDDDVDINGVLTTDGINASSIIVVDSSPYAVLAANTGMIHTIADLGQNTSIDLPAEAAGLNYVFWYIGGADEAHDHDIDTENNTNFFIGGVAFADTDAGSGADEINAGIYSDGDSNSKLTISNASAGTRVEVTCDGTNWFINGVIYSDTAPAFADQ